MEEGAGPQAPKTPLAYACSFLFYYKVFNSLDTVADDDAHLFLDCLLHLHTLKKHPPTKITAPP